MLEVLRRLLLIMVCVCLTACTTTRVIAQRSEASLAALRRSPAIGDPRAFVIAVVGALVVVVAGTISASKSLARSFAAATP